MSKVPAKKLRLLEKEKGSSDEAQIEWKMLSNAAHFSDVKVVSCSHQ
jgi:hypothetical protein